MKIFLHRPKPRDGGKSIYDGESAFLGKKKSSRIPSLFSSLAGFCPDFPSFRPFQFFSSPPSSLPGQPGQPILPFFRPLKSLCILFFFLGWKVLLGLPFVVRIEHSVLKKALLILRRKSTPGQALHKPNADRGVKFTDISDAYFRWSNIGDREQGFFLQIN